MTQEAIQRAQQVIQSDDDLLTILQVAEHLQVRPNTVRNFIRTEGLPVRRVNHKVVRVVRGELNKWVQSRPCSAAGA